MSEVKIRRPREIIKEQVLFKKRISIGPDIYEHPISYMTNNLVIQTPIVYIPYSTYKVNDKITFDIEFINLDKDKEMSELKDFVQSMNKLALDKIYNSNLKCKVGKKQKKEFISNIKQTKTSCRTGKPDRMRLCLFETTSAFNDHGEKISLDNLKSKTRLRLLISPTKIWLNGNKFGIFWEALQVKIYPRMVLDNYMFLTEENNLFKQNKCEYCNQCYSETKAFNPKTLPVNPELIKYFDMLKKGVPKGAVKNKMMMDNIDPTLLDIKNNKHSHKTNKHSNIIHPLQSPSDHPIPPPPLPQFLTISSHNQSINKNTTNSGKSDQNALFRELLSSKPSLKKISEDDKNKYKTMKKDKKGLNYTPSLSDILTARNSLKKYKPISI